MIKFKLNILLMVMISITAFACNKGIQQDTIVANIIKYVESLNNKKLNEITLELDGIYKEIDATSLINIGYSKITGYYDGENLVKLKVYYNGSSGDLTTIYICRNDSPVFVKKNLVIFKPPKHEIESKIINEIENEFYLSNNKILNFKNKGGVIRFNKPNELNLELKFIELKKDFKNYFNTVKKIKSKQ